MSYLKYILKYILHKFAFNIFTNNIYVALKLDRILVRRLNPYLTFKPKQGGTLQEIAGFSLRKEIDEVLDKSHADLKNLIKSNLKSGSKVLDIGCGPGLYLKDFPSDHILFGQDISSEMIHIASKELPNASFIKGNIMDVELPTDFNLIYSIGVLIYIPPSELEALISKIYNSLKPGGLFYLNYPHAISFKDLFYPDLTYVQYSPRKIEKIVSRFFKIQYHKHAFDERIVDLYDKNPYKSLNPNTNRTYKNSYLLIARKS
jgi:SAM-dependent methyltransferase